MEDIAPFTPVNFFQLQNDCLYLPVQIKTPFSLNGSNAKKYLLPDTSALTDEIAFAEVSMGWNEEGIEFYVNVLQPYQKSSYPLLEKGDSLEVCIDTRNIKTSGYNTRFCHHFFCLVEGTDGRQAGD